MYLNTSHPLLTDYKSILMTRISYSDEYLTNMFSFVIFRCCCCCCRVHSRCCCCCWKLITLAFMHFHHERSLVFHFELNFGFIYFFHTLFFESLEAHFIREKKNKNKKIKKIRPRFIKWMTSHHLSVDVCFFPHQCLWHAIFLDGSRAFQWTCFIVHCLLARFSCM